MVKGLLSRAVQPPAFLARGLRDGTTSKDVWRNVALLAALGLAVPLLLNFWMVSNPFTVLVVLRYVAVVGFMLIAFRWVADDAPWPVRLMLSMILGQIILNYGFSNLVVGAGSVKFTVAELGVVLGLLFLWPKCLPILKQAPAFWICLAAIIVPPTVHLYTGVRTYGMAAMRDILSVVDLVYFLGGMTVVSFGVMRGQWTLWRSRFLKTWIIVGLIYGCMAPFSQFIQAYSPRMQGYQQSLPILGYMVTSAITAIGAVTAWYAIPFVYPKAAWLRYPLMVLVFVGTLAAVGMAQSRNLYVGLLMLPFILAFFGYRSAFAATLGGVVMLVAALGTMEAFDVKIEGRLSQVTLSAVADRLLSISGEHGDSYGAHGVQQRLDWWTYSLNRWSASPDTVLFGVGYGMPLTNFISPGGDDGLGVVVREPHNSFISSLTRGGLVYFLLWGYVVFAPLLMAVRGARMKSLSPEVGGHYRGVAAWSVVMMVMILFQSLSEPHFETPSIAAMYYFLAGMALMEYLSITGRVKYPPLRSPV